MDETQSMKVISPKSFNMAFTDWNTYISRHKYIIWYIGIIAITQFTTKDLH